MADPATVAPLRSSLRPPPQLPLGTSSTLRGIGENFSFHSSPESFIASRIQKWQQQNPSALDSRFPIRAKILNRNVAIISSYRQIQEILTATNGNQAEDDQQPVFVAAKAYDELMTAFFPPPNLLLADGCPHMKMRNVWDEKMRSFRASPYGSTSSLSGMVSSFFDDGLCFPRNQPVDLYETMKRFTWRILLGAFLGLSPNEDTTLFAQVQKLHEDLLRGQFSLMPLSVNMKVWRSPRSKGIAARQKLQAIIMQRLRGMYAAGKMVFPFVQGESMEEVRDHVLMMTSSLAVKGIASLMTAFFLNLFLFERGGVKILDELNMMAEAGDDERHWRYLRSIYLETERLSPPIVGIMRHVNQDVVLTSNDADTLLPAGWDLWMYFLGGERDAAIFGETCMEFNPSRYMADTIPAPLSFGAGSKSCLGKVFIRDLAILAAEHCLRSAVNMQCDLSKAGLKAWLGWDVATPEQWAADMKQLPTQHPATPLLVDFRKAQ